MKSTALSFSSLVAVASVVALVLSQPCNLPEIQAKLFPNATEGLQQCANATGVNIWELNEFPSKEEAQAVMKDRTCVEFFNQINRLANQEIQCDLTIGDTTKDFATMISDLLTGRTGNETETTSSSSSSSGSQASLPPGSAGTSGSGSQTDGSKSSTTAPTEAPSTAGSQTSGGSSSLRMAVSAPITVGALLLAMVQA